MATVKELKATARPKSGKGAARAERRAGRVPGVIYGNNQPPVTISVEDAERALRDYQEQLERVAGKVEMGLRVAWDVPNIFEYFVNTHAELRLARDRLVGARHEFTQEEKIELGRMFDRLLNDDREDHTRKVERVLAPVCAEFKANPCRNEHEVMNLACLVRRDAQEEFSAGVFAAAKLFDNNFAFDYSGPWAPHNFVDLELDLER